MRLDAEIEALAAQQHGCVATWQLRDLGVASIEITRLKRRHWEQMNPRVLRLRGSPATDLQRAMAALLEAGPGSAISHVSVGHLWDLGGYYRLLPVQVCRLEGIARAGTQGRIHPIAGFPQNWVTTLNGLTVVRPELCIYQLCGTEHPKRAERALDRAWSNGLLSGASTRACLTEMRRSGRNGTIVLEGLLDARGPDYVPPASNNEARLNELTGELGMKFRRQVDVGADRWDGRVDFREDVLPFIVEVLSERYHLALSDKADDADRFDRLERGGHVVVPIWDTQLWYRRDEAMALLRSGYHKARVAFS